MRPVFAAFVVASTLCMSSLSARAAGDVETHDTLMAQANTSSDPPLRVLSDSEQRARDREQVLGLEERVNRQQLELNAMRQAIAGAQTKASEPETSRPTDPALYGLAMVALALLVTIAFMQGRIVRLQRRVVLAEKQRAQADAGVPRRSPTVRTSPMPVTPPLDEATMTSMRVLDEPVTEAADPDGPTIAQTAQERHEMSTDELIDLEQQADFYIALGQEETAIDLLMSHVRSSGGTSPMPYLKLLAIYRKRSDGDAYERIRERFNRRFNAQAPSWEDYDRGHRALQAYDGVSERVIAAWRNPAEAVDLLQALLYRRDASAEPFELPAYQELLFLHAVARDVLEHMVNPDGVDLLLPMGADLEEPPIMHYEVSRAPESWKSAAVDLDIVLPTTPSAPSKL